MSNTWTPPANPQVRHDGGRDGTVTFAAEGTEHTISWTDAQALALQILLPVWFGDTGWEDPRQGDRRMSIYLDVDDVEGLDKYQSIADNVVQDLREHFAPTESDTERNDGVPTGQGGYNGPFVRKVKAVLEGETLAEWEA